MKKKSIGMSGYSIAVLVVAAIAAGVWLLRPASPDPAPEVGFTTIAGERLSMRALRGQVVLVKFWATDCAVCIREMPMMVDTFRRFEREGLAAVFVAMAHDQPGRVVKYAKDAGLPFRVVLDLDGSIAQAFGDVKLTPTTFVIDRAGRIVMRVLGEPDAERLHALLARKLAEPT